MLHFIIGKAGCGKTHEIYQLLENLPNGSQGILLVPEQASFENERNMLSLPPEKRCEVLSFTRLCDRVFKTYGGIAGTMITKEEKIMVIARSVEQVKDQLQIYRKQVKYTEFYTHLLAIVSECYFKGITPADLQFAASRVPSLTLQQKLNEIALIFGVYRRLVEEHYIDPDLQQEKALALLQDKDFWHGKTIFIDDFKDFTYPQKQLIAQMVESADEVYLTVCADGEYPHHDFEIFENAKSLMAEFKRQLKGQTTVHKILTKNHRAQTPALEILEGILAGEDLSFENTANEITICECVDQYDQAQTVAATISSLVREGQIRYRDIGVITGDPNHQDSLESAFRRYNIPYFSDKRTPFGSSPLAHFCKQTLALTLKGFSTAGLFSFMKTGLTSLTDEEISLLETYAFTWSVDGKGWTEEFVHHPSNAKNPNPAEIAQCNQLRQQIILPLLQLKGSFAKATTCQDYAEALYNYLHTARIFEGVKKLAQEMEQQKDPLAQEDLLRSPVVLIDLLDRMVRALGDQPLTLEDFNRFFLLMASSATLGALPKGIDQVLLGDAARTRMDNPQVVFVVGANQGVFPGIPTSGGLLSDYDRTMLNQVDIPFSDHGRFDMVEENFLFYRIACAAKSRVYFTYLTAKKASLCTPLEKVKKAMPHCNLISSETLPKEMVTGALFPALEYLVQNYCTDSPFTNSLYAYFETHHKELLTLCQQQTLPTDCSVDPTVAKALFNRSGTISPTGIEQYHQCRFLYLCQQSLNLPQKNPVELNGMSRGHLFHYVLEQMLQKHPVEEYVGLEQEEIGQNAAAEIHTLMLQYLDEKMGGSAEKSRVFWFQFEQAYAFVIVMYARVIKSFTESYFRPKFFEYKMSNNADANMPPFQLSLEDGTPLQISGTADRVDTYKKIKKDQNGKEDKKNSNTYFRVVDYKTGGKKFTVEDLYHGIGLQMLLYSLALSKNKTVFEGKTTNAGVLYTPLVQSHSNISKKDPQKEAEKDLRMQGLVLDDDAVIEATDPEKKGNYTPFHYNQYGRYDMSSALASPEFFEKIFAHAETLLVDMGNSLRKGEFTCNPIESSIGNPCEYCPYKAACPGGGEQEAEKIPTLKPSERVNLLKGGDYNGISH